MPEKTLHPLPQLIPQRLAALLKRFREKVWTIDAEPLALETTESFQRHRTFDEAMGESFTAIEEFPFDWGKMFDQRWFRLRFPKNSGGRHLLWKAGGEGTLYIDGFPYYGIDIAHPHAPLPEGVTEAYLEALCLENGIWATRPYQGFSREFGVRIHGAFLATRNELYWQAENDLEVLLDVLAEDYRLQNGEKNPFSTHFGPVLPLDRAPPRFRKILRELDFATNAYEADGIEAFVKQTRQIFDMLQNDRPSLKAVHSGHAHIDLVWLWPESSGVYKAVHTFATANRLLEKYPEFRFGYSQPQSYEAVGKRCPALLEAVQQKEKNGAWEMTGGAYVENDTNMPTGEAMLRGLLIGQDRFKKLKGNVSTTYWLPDVFGYSGCLPQVMRAAGIDYFYTTKLTWSAINRFPYHSFTWKGNDGTSVIAHVSAGHGYVEAVNVRTLREAEVLYQQSDVHDEILVPTGYGDGGGGVTEKMCERVRRLAHIEGCPACEWGKIEDFFERLAERRHQLPQHQGELYLEYHRGVLTTHGDLKAAYRGLERVLLALEAAHAATGKGPVDEHYWERLIFTQFHDYLPGSSIHEVYAEGVPELRELAERALAETTQVLGGEGEEAIFNPCAVERAVWLDVDGSKVRATLPPLSGISLAKLEQDEAPPPVTASANSLSNERLKATFNDRGEISELIIDGRKTPIAAPLGHLMWFDDFPHAYDAWELDRPMLENGQSFEQAAECTVKQEGSHAAEVVFTRPVGETSTATITYRVQGGSSVLEVELDIDWKDPNTLLRICFPTQFSGSNARYGSPFGSTLRSQKHEGPRSEAQWEVPASRWAAVCDDCECDGLFLITESKYGFSCRDGAMTISLIKCAKVTEAGNSAARDLEVDTLYSDVFRHKIRLALGRYDCCAPRAEQPAALAETLYTPPVRYGGSPISTPFKGIEGGESLQVAWVLPQQDGSMLLRLHETLGHRGVCQICSDADVTVTNAQGNEEIRRLDRGYLEFRPYELLTVKLG